MIGVVVALTRVTEACQRAVREAVAPRPYPYDVMGAISAAEANLQAAKRMAQRLSEENRQPTSDPYDCGVE